ncbi:hypothetical protein [Actinomadura sp. DC4]|uniref:hypothetical protein n=1 Tax=Actinomadura sp. DC4 TaxID=3055069 RepID=UPI0025B1DB5B|nr:hypothetical protein [Actinomadura sp. DC4]MDN3355986.1 hypothetical protein [Actinomadura sp. DC4]
MAKAPRRAKNGLRPIDPMRPATLGPDVTLVVLPWGRGVTGRQSRPKAPKNWRLVEARRSHLDGWAAWRRTL